MRALLMAAVVLWGCGGNDRRGGVDAGAAVDDAGVPTPMCLTTSAGLDPLARCPDGWFAVCSGSFVTDDAGCRPGDDLQLGTCCDGDGCPDAPFCQDEALTPNCVRAPDGCDF